MAENTKKPAIRFAGFTEAWEQRKLSELCSLVTKGTTPLDKSSVGTVNFVKIESIDEVSGEIKITQKITDEEHNGYLRRSQLKKDDILFSIAGTLGRVTAVKSSILPANTNQALAIIRLKSGCLQYIKTYLKGKVVADFIKENPTIGAQANLSLEQVGNLEISIPTENEQKLIGAYFVNLDNLITLHQRKYDKLTNAKKSMLEKMFPKNGSNVPEIRFKGFTETWEQRKLGEIFEEYSEKNHDKLPALMIIQGGGTIRRDESDRSLLYDKANLANYKMVNEGDFIVHLRSFEGGLEMATNTGIISPAYHTFHGENTDSRFYYLYFRSKKFIDIDLKPHVYGIRDGRSIDIEGMKTVKIPFTSYEEQKAIGMFIKHLDHLITLHQRKLEKLKIIKKSFLEKMFV